MSEQVFLILIIAAALLYDFVNGFHDAANAIATTVATHAMSPRNAIIVARSLNFVGGLLHTAVAYTIGKGVIDSNVITLPILLAAVLGAVLWGYFTWYLGLPSSSTHALVGGLLGVGLFANNFNFDILIWKGIRKILIFMVVSPIVGTILGVALIAIFSWSVWKSNYRKSAWVFKKLQVLSASFVALTHGMNDAQNAMGIITVALLSAGILKEFNVPLWVRVASAFMIGVGTSVGGWRIIKTMGKKMTDLHEPIDGCAAEMAAGTSILVASLVGAPISTSHVATSSIAGTAIAHRLSNVRWNIVTNIVMAWVFTFPGAGIFGIGIYLIVRVLT
jgi:PiT family inorganic phosphate transporter